MQYKKTAFYFLFVGIAMVIAASIFLTTATPVSAQCGSQASSCKNCHEAQAEMPVNAAGTGWHQSHAFGDFCYICHAGNNQATDKAAAHEGMVAPLCDVQASCQQCHVADLDARAQVYAGTLGVGVGSGSIYTVCNFYAYRNLHPDINIHALFHANANFYRNAVFHTNAVSRLLS